MGAPSIPNRLEDELWNPPAYVEAVRRRLASVMEGGELEPIEIYRRMQGAFPTLVRRLGDLDSAPTTGSSADGRELAVQESPSQGEWYFTEETSRGLASQLGPAPLLLGTPSVAEVAERGTLVDDSAWVSVKFKLSMVRVENYPIEDVKLTDGYDSAVLDPPWYSRALVEWLQFASHLTVAGGTIMVPLMGELTRPSAREDRKAILTLASAIGPNEIRADALQYSLPHFETAALRAGGLEIAAPWRRADLLVLQNTRPAAAPRLTPTRTEWIDYRVGRKVVSFRPGPSREREGFAFGPIVGTTGWTLPSVSHRHPSMRAAGLWSSENRVAQVYSPGRVRQALELLQVGRSSVVGDQIVKCLLGGSVE